jgi:transcriptional regulator with XRE-family HTH domain
MFLPPFQCSETIKKSYLSLQHCDITCFMIHCGAIWEDNNTMSERLQGKSSINGIILRRLISALNELGYKKHGRVSKIAAETGYSKSAISDYLSAKVPLQERFITVACNKLGISEKWIVSGEGEKFATPPVGEGEQPHAERRAGWSPIYDLLLAEFQKLPAEKQHRAIAYVIEIGKSSEEEKK